MFLDVYGVIIYNLKKLEIIFIFNNMETSIIILWCIYLTEFYKVI